MASLKRNLGYQSAYQILNIGLPLITAPFLARVLGAEPLGIMSYTSSVVHYFSLFAMMGIINYGTRSIAVVKDNPIMRNRLFSEIYFLQLSTTGISFLAYLAYLLFFCKANVAIQWIQSMAIIVCFFDISWFFFGIEEFKIPVICSMIIRVLSVIMMLVLIKSPSDLWIYALLLIGCPLVSQVLLWFFVPKFVTMQKIKFCMIKKHIQPNIKLFIPLLAMSVYHLMDKTMLGVLSNYTQCGYYYNADKVINIPIGLLTGVGTVMLPRMSLLAGENRKSELDSLFNTSIKTIGLVSSAMCCGIAAIANEFTPFFFGPGYEECILLIIFLAPVLFIKGFSLISRNLYLIPNKMENKLTASVIAGAVVNFCVNIILIPSKGALGAVIGTLVAEIVSCVWQYAAIARKVHCIKSVMIGQFYFFLGILMFVGVRFIANELQTSLIIKLAVEISLGAFFYMILCLIYWGITKNNFALSFIKSRFGWQE